MNGPQADDSQAAAASAGASPGAQPSRSAPGSKPDRQEPASLDPGLYIVATPIGNLGDITARARAVLSAAATVYCEDTRVTGALMQALGLRVRLSAYHEHNAERVRPQILARLADGEALALVSDAGTPLISDPGYKLVREVAAAGHAVIPVPGASALLAALVTAGLPTDRFLFAGFPPAKDAARRSWLADLGAIPATLVIYESTRRLPETLASMAEVLGDRPAAVCRELTKLFEEVRRDTLPALAAAYAAEGAPKGEAVVVIGPPSAAAQTEAAADGLDERLRAALAGGLSVRDAAAAVATATGLPRKRVYARALDLQQDKDSTS